MRPAASRILRPLSRLSTATIRQPALPTRRFPLLPARPSPILLSIRHASSLPPPSSSPPSSSSSDPKGEKIASFPLADKPSYELTFTCKRCSNRSTHKMSKQAYHKGTVLIQCPGCNVRHLIADHLKIFTDKPTTIEDIMKEKGEILKRGVRYENGDVEILPEGEEEVTDGVERLEGEK